MKNLAVVALDFSSVAKPTSAKGETVRVLEEVRVPGHVSFAG